MLGLMTRVDQGHYNWCDPSQLSTHIHIRVTGTEDEVKPVNLSLDADEYEKWQDYFREDPFEAALEAIKEYQDRTLYSSDMDKVKAMAAYLEAHRTEIEIGVNEAQLKAVEEQIKRLEKRRESLVSVRDMLLEELAGKGA